MVCVFVFAVSSLSSCTDVGALDLCFQVHNMCCASIPRHSMYVPCPVSVLDVMLGGSSVFWWQKGFRGGQGSINNALVVQVGFQFLGFVRDTGTLHALQGVGMR